MIYRFIELSLFTFRKLFVCFPIYYPSCASSFLSALLSVKECISEMHFEIPPRREWISQDFRLWSSLRVFSGDLRTVLIEVRCFHNLIISSWNMKSQRDVHSHAGFSFSMFLFNASFVSSETLLFNIIVFQRLKWKEETENNMIKLSKKLKYISVVNVLLIGSVASFGSFYSFFYRARGSFVFQASFFMFQASHLTRCLCSNNYHLSLMRVFWF